jgi:hypothetical protein
MQSISSAWTRQFWELREMRGRKSHNCFSNVDIPTNENQEMIPEAADEKNDLMDDNSINKSRNEGIFLN